MKVKERERERGKHTTIDYFNLLQITLFSFLRCALIYFLHFYEGCTEKNSKFNEIHFHGAQTRLKIIIKMQ